MYYVNKYLKLCEGVSIREVTYCCAGQYSSSLVPRENKIGNPNFFAQGLVFLVKKNVGSRLAGQYTQHTAVGR